MDSTHGSLAIDIRTQGVFRPAVLARSRAMIVAALQEANIQEGRFRFDADGPCADMEHYSQPRLDMQASAQIQISVFVRIKCCNGGDGTLKGMMRLPPGIDRKKFLDELAPGIENYNRSGWREVLQQIPPEPPPERRPAPVANLPGTHPVASVVAELSGVAATQSKPPVADNSVKSLPSGDEARPDKAAKLAGFLRTMLADSTNGVFRGSGTTAALTRLFPGANARGLVTGTLSAMCGYGWIRRVEGGYQVEVAFLKQQGLEMVINPLPKLKRGEKVKARTVHAPQVPSASSGDLNQKLRALEDLIAERARLEAELEAAQAMVIERQEAISEFNRRVSPLLERLQSK